MSARQKENNDTTSPAAPALAGFSRLGEGDYHARLAATPGRGVVIFSAPRCGACRAWKHQLLHMLSDSVNAFYEVDVSEATGVAHYFGIFHLPTVYLYRDGIFHAELQCEMQSDTIRQTAQRLFAAPAEEEP